MKLSVIQENLARGLAVVGHGVASRNTLPILSNVYLGTEDGGLRLVATNLEIAVTHWVPAKIEEKGATTIPARLLSDVVNGLPNEKIDISLLPDGRVHLKCGRSASHLRATPADDFPQVGAAGERVTARISQKELRAALDSTVFAAAGDEARPILTGVLTSFTGEKATFAAADNYRIAVAGAALAEAAPETSIIVPARAYAELLRLLSDVDDLVEITLTPAKNQLQFKLGDTMLVSRLIDGQFPPFQQVIPTSHTTKVTVVRDDFLRAVRLAQVVADASAHIVRFAITPEGGGAIDITAAADVGDHAAHVEAKVEGEGTTIAFNAKYLVDVLSRVEADQFSLELTGPIAPGLLRPLDGRDYLHVVMPVRTPS